MYSNEKRMKAIELYIKYDKSAAAVVRELGYPSCKMLTRWYKAYLEEQKTGVIQDRYARRSKYSLEQKAAAVEHYLESVSYTHLRAHETDSYLVCRLLLEKK